MKKMLAIILATAMLALGSVMAFAAETAPVAPNCPGQSAMFDQLAKDNVLSAEKAKKLGEYMQANCPRQNGEFKRGMGMMNNGVTMHKAMLDKAVADGVLSSEEAVKVDEYMLKNCPQNGGHHGKHGRMGNGNGNGNGNCPMNRTNQ